MIGQSCMENWLNGEYEFCLDINELFISCLKINFSIKENGEGLINGYTIE